VQGAHGRHETGVAGAARAAQGDELRDAFDDYHDS
jgi:hypothetical protein